VVVVAACSSSTNAPHVMLDFTRAHSLYDAPVPSDDLMQGSAFDAQVMPDPLNLSMVEQVRTLLAGADGFAASGGVFFQISEAIDPAGLPSIAQSVTCHPAGKMSRRCDATSGSPPV